MKLPFLIFFIGPRLARKDANNYPFQGITYQNNFKFSKMNSQDIIILAEEINITKSSAVDGFSSKILLDTIYQNHDNYLILIMVM